MRAKKSYGQHFLINEGIAMKIVSGLDYSWNDGRVLEVGPGKGVLTKYFISEKRDFKVVEADRDMVSYLKNQFGIDDHIIEADFLKTDLEDTFGGKEFALIGNYPYNISSQIMFKMLDNRHLIPQMVGMFQKEVAARIVAKPGNKTYGVISVLIQAYYDGEYLFDVENINFDPPPKVVSGVIRMTRKENLELGCDSSLFKSVVKQSFSQRRKMLRNTLKPFLKGNPILQTDIFLQRPEKLSVEEFIEICKIIEKENI